LGQIETGASQAGPSAADKIRGKNNELSRYQVLPRVWARYSASLDFRNPVHAWTVAQRILQDRQQRFRRSAGRDADPFDLYVLWNAPGHYQQVGFAHAQVRPTVADRAHRFAALVQAYWDQSLRAQN